MADGTGVHAIRAAGVQAEVLAYGGIIRSLAVPDREGRTADVVLGFDAPTDYVEGNDARFGALIGRFANRIGHGEFTLDGRTHALAVNEPPHHLHGGPGGFDRVVWEVEDAGGGRGYALHLRYTSPDGEEGYPGTLQVRATYTLTAGHALVVDFQATTDGATPVNLTQHSYFNLGGPAAGDVLDHVLVIPADHFTPVDPSLLPTGEIRPVDGTPFDFREPRRIGDRIDDDHEQLRRGGGYDHNFVLGPPDADGLRPAARLEDPKSGRVLEVRTTEPGLQLYTGNGLAGTPAKGGGRYARHAGVALETQRFPDSPNRPEFPSAVLRPGETLRSRTVFTFLTSPPGPG